MDAKIIKDLQDLTYLSWTKIRNSSGTAGSFLKAYDDFGTKKKYYKLSNYNIEEGIVGHESINEIIVDRLLTLLGIPHLAYNLIHANIVLDDKAIDTYVCMSEDFKEPGESKIALDAYFQAERNNGENLLEFCIRQGWEEYIYQMLVIDYLILNRDRHGANIEVLRSAGTKSVRLAPLFDHGVSFFCRTSEEGLEKEDVMADKRVQCFVGSRSAWESLHLIPRDEHPQLKPLKESDKSILFDGLDGVLSARRIDCTWEMIRRRWQAYENLRNQG